MTDTKLRGFGFTFERGRIRNWYIDSEGVKRWVDTDKAVEAVEAVEALEVGDDN